MALYYMSVEAAIGGHAAFYIDHIARLELTKICFA